MQILISCSSDQDLAFCLHQSVFLQVQSEFNDYKKLRTYFELKDLMESTEILSEQSLSAYSREVLFCRSGGHGILNRELLWMQREVGVIGRGKH